MEGGGHTIVEVRPHLRAGNRLTLPSSVVRKLGLKPGDSLIVRMDESAPDTVCLRRLPDSFAGMVAGVYGNADEVAAYVQGERDAWRKDVT
jgi:bifunctional DNA-binding transcriptional regulator/antitoxin component of YhaV-PrlF toxin-antitoxin module